MNIQSGYSVLSYQGADQVGISKLGAAMKKPAPSETTAAQGFGSSTTQVSISDEARRRASQDGVAVQGRTAAQEKLLNAAAADPQTAEKLASEMATTPSTIFFDLRGVGGGDAVNKLSSGRIVDDAFKQKFSSEASVIDAQRKALYDSEKSKGTPPDQILAKLVDFTNAQSKDYLEATAWQGSVGGKAA